MGYGLEVNVPVLVNRNPRFDVVLRHYRAFNLETGPASGMDLMVHPAAQSRFSSFLELVQMLDAANSSTVLVVNHGLSERVTDKPLGLTLPLTANTPNWNVDEYTLGLLSKFISVIPDDDRCRELEKGSLMNGVPMPAGTLKPLGTALQNLRIKRRLRRLELRACNLGGNPDVMEMLGEVLGVGTVVAPKTHMFYVGLLARQLPVPFSDAGFDNWLKGFPRARVFRDTAGGGRVAIQIHGQHAFRSMDCATTVLDVKWFIEKYVCPGSGYVPAAPGRGAHVAEFTIAGMDSGTSFVLGLEDDYEGQLVEKSIQRVPLLTTVETR